MSDPRSFLNSLPVAGGLFSSLWGDPAQEAKQKAMAQAQQAMFAYRPVALDARMHAMNNESAAFGPMQQLLGQMYGGGAQTDMSKLIGNPFNGEAMNEMMAKARPPQKPQSQPLRYEQASGPTGREGKQSWER